ncbi:MAG: hypothetical protein WBC70_00745 [Candidatus Aminicenantales bacterium]
MKKALLGLICLGLCGLACALAEEQRLEFHSPSFEAPFYRIQFPFEIAPDGNAVIKEIRLNGTRTGPFLVFQDGTNIPLSKPLERGTYTVVLDYAWAARKVSTASTG